MAKIYHGIGGGSLSKERQREIYSTCKNFADQPQKMQEKILRLCRMAGGYNADALFEMLTTDQKLERILQKYYIASTTTLYRARNKLFELWAKEEKWT